MSFLEKLFGHNNKPESAQPEVIPVPQPTTAENLDSAVGISAAEAGIATGATPEAPTTPETTPVEPDVPEVAPDLGNIALTTIPETEVTPSEPSTNDGFTIPTAVTSETPAAEAFTSTSEAPVENVPEAPVDFTAPTSEQVADTPSETVAAPTVDVQAPTQQ